MALYTGYYINRDQDIERRIATEAQIAALDPPGRYRRFSAVDGNAFGLLGTRLTDGEIGCFYSHYLLLQMHLDRPTYLHVLEDDCLMSKRTVHFLDRFIAGGWLDTVDILFIESTLPNDFKVWRDARATYAQSITRAADGSVIDVRFGDMTYIGCMTSYLVNPRSIALICECLAEELENGDPRPVDLAIRSFAATGRLRVKSLFPFITSVRPEAFTSTVQHDYDKYSRFAMEMLRHSFYVECDPARAAMLTAQWLGGSEATPLERLHQELATFMASDKYREI
jgi:GR25 family glycosyltransferase involved in LPS biosynthesis